MSDDFTQIQKDLYVWAAAHGILTDAAAREAAALDGKASRIPFDDEHAGFFRTRRIVRIRLDRDSHPARLTVFGRQNIAQAKAKTLIDLFASEFGHDIELAFSTSKPYKIDNQLQAYGQFHPIVRRRRKVCCGSSVGIGNQRNAGTLTALVRDEIGQLFGLSCNHVAGGCNTALPGTPIVVPGIQDVTVDNTEIVVVGLHNRTTPMSQGLPTVFDISSNSDLAFFELNPDGRKLLTSWQGAGPDSYDTPDTFEQTIKRGLRVKKWGRSTGFQTGRVVEVLRDPEPLEYSVVSHFGPQNSQDFRGTVYYPEAYEVASAKGGIPFSLPGDSGSLVVTDDDSSERVVGIIVAGSETKTLVLPLEPALATAKLKLVSNHNT